LSIHSPARGGFRKDYTEVIPASGQDVEKMLADRQRNKIFSKKVKEFSHKLSGREANIFRKRLMTDDPLTLQELGDRYQISRERVRQIELKIIGKLKVWLKKEVPEFEKEFAGVSL
jgi:RNA polymerase sigma-32 factor